ncbi:MAG TPA: putative cytokinetic ring protein SteA [Actinomycetota bacterium]|nr:putative cytokinetic ring protein SteA [Actinomycetota bacterium]
MKVLRRRRRPIAPGEGLVRTARVDTRTKDLIARIEPGEIAIIDHDDLDRIAAEGLVQKRVTGVVNAGTSITGRYPNLGPLLLVTSGIPLIDSCGPAVMSIAEGSRVALEGDKVAVVEASGNRVVTRGHLLTLEEVEAKLDSSKRSIADELERFAENTMSYIREERDVLLDAARLPEVKTDFHGRHVLVVVRGHDYKEDLAALRSYIREVDPLLIGVDGGADALLDVGHKPDLIIGDMDSVTTEALVSGAELVVHAYSDGHAPGLERIEALGLPSVLYRATGTSEDIAMLLAFERGAELIVAVGTHANLVEFLDKGRKGMASTFLVRLRVGPVLVDAKGVSRLYKTRVRRKDLVMLVAAAVLAMAIVVSLSEPLRLELQLVWTQLQTAWFSLKESVFS